MAYSKQTWDTTSYVNPTRMNHIEDGIASIPWVEYGQTTSVTISANSYQDVTINFSEIHGSNPMIIPAIKSTGANPDNVTAWNNINCIVLPATSSTSATIRIFNANTAINVSAYLSYIVVG